MRGHHRSHRRCWSGGQPARSCRSSGGAGSQRRRSIRHAAKPHINRNARRHLLACIAYRGLDSGSQPSARARRPTSCSSRRPRLRRVRGLAEALDVMRAKVTEWSGAPQMDTGAPLPAIHVAGNELYVAYVTQTAGEYAVVLFQGVQQHTYGYPNDEALAGHPLYKLGLQFYAFNEVTDSPQVKELTARNASVFPGGHNPFRSARHWVVSFHDETLEVIGSAVSSLGVVQTRSSEEAIAHAVQQQVPADVPASAARRQGRG